MLDPADVALPNWRQRSQGRGFRDTRLDPCGGTAYPAERARVAGVWRVMAPPSEETPEGGSTEQHVHAYPDAAAAEEAGAGYRRAVRRCPKHDEREGPATVQVTYTVVGDRPLLVERTYRTTSGPTGSRFPDYVAVVRHDDVVTLVTMSFGEGADRAGARRVTAAAERELRAAAG